MSYGYASVGYSTLERTFKCIFENSQKQRATTTNMTNKKYNIHSIASFLWSPPQKKNIERSRTK